MRAATLGSWALRAYGLGGARHERVPCPVHVCHAMALNGALDRIFRHTKHTVWRTLAQPDSYSAGEIGIWRVASPARRARALSALLSQPPQRHLARLDVISRYHPRRLARSCSRWRSLAVSPIYPLWNSHTPRPDCGLRQLIPICYVVPNDCAPERPHFEWLHGFPGVRLGDEARLMAAAFAEADGFYTRLTRLCRLAALWKPFCGLFAILLASF